MNIPRFRHVGFLSLLLIALSPPAFSQIEDPASPQPEIDRQRGILPGERLEFSIDWIGINAGTAVMEVRPPILLGEDRVYPIVSIARSNDFVSRFFPVEDRIETYMDTEDLLPVVIKIHQREGDRTKNREVSYDRKNRKAVQIEDGKEEKYDMDPSAQDALSVLYYFRNMTFPAEGATTVIKVFEGDKNWDLEIRMLGKEAIETPAGNFNTVKVIVMARYEGLFLNKGDITIWFTDDKKHTPVQMKSRVSIGSVTVRLISMDSPSDSAASSSEK